MIIKELGRLGPPGYERLVLRKCDFCGREDEACWSSLRHSRKHRKSEKDVCSDCARKFRKIPRGKDNGHWKHGLTPIGYRRVSLDDGRRIYEHIAVMEQFLQRRLAEGEIVHHINLDKSDNRLENLHLFHSNSEHRICHRSLDNIGYTLLEKSIWFNAEIKQYVSYAVPQRQYNLAEIEGCPLEIRQYLDNRSGHIHEYVKNEEDRGWKWKRYYVVVSEKMMGRKLTY